MNFRGLLGIFAKTGKAVGVDILKQTFPATFQIVEYLLGSGTGKEKFTTSAEIGLLLLTAAAKAGKLDGAIPSLDEIKKVAQASFDESVANGSLKEVSEFMLAGKRFKIVAVE